MASVATAHTLQTGQEGGMKALVVGCAIAAGAAAVMFVQAITSPPPAAPAAREMPNRETAIAYVTQSVARMYADMTRTPLPR